MIEPLLAPVALALTVLMLGTAAHRRLPPSVAARFMIVAVVLAVVATLPTVLLLALAFLAHVPIIGIGFEWCVQAVGLHGSVPAWMGIPAVAVIATGLWRSVRLIRAHRSLCRRDGTHIQMIDSDAPYAVTLPGAAGQIVVSTALWRSLDERERLVVLAHEQSHARHRHDRYLLTAQLASAVFPPLRGLSRRLSFTIERWADEDAAVRCGDRHLVARTLGKVALASPVAMVANFAGLGVVGRMNALFSRPTDRPTRNVVLGLWASLVLAAGATLLQLHHLERLVVALCPH